MIGIDRSPTMRVHLHHEQKGFMPRAEIGRRLYAMGLSERVLNAREVCTIEQRALKKLRKALAPLKNGGPS